MLDFILDFIDFWTDWIWGLGIDFEDILVLKHIDRGMEKLFIVSARLAYVSLMMLMTGGLYIFWMIHKRNKHRKQQKKH